jgi:hypothetical protein
VEGRVPRRPARKLSRWSVSVLFIRFESTANLIKKIYTGTCGGSSAACLAARQSRVLKV